jgi:flagellar motor switch protein FliM
VLNYRYGSAGAKGALPDPARVRVTATEERLAVVLGQQLVSSLFARIHKNLQALGKNSAIDASAEVAVQSGVHPPAAAGSSPSRSAMSRRGRAAASGFRSTSA